MTVVIVGVLAAIAVPTAELVTKRSQERALSRSLIQIREAIDAYKVAAEAGRVEKTADQSGYPATLEVLVDGVVDLKDPKRNKIYFLRRLPRDPLARDEMSRPSYTWAKRSYRSPADQPEEGEDVFDVYSKSGGIGLNGVAYRDW